MSNRRLLQVSTGHVYVWTETLAKKKGMKEITIDQANQFTRKTIIHIGEPAVIQPIPNYVEIVETEMMTDTAIQNPVIETVIIDAASSAVPQVEAPNIVEHEDAEAKREEAEKEAADDIDAIMLARTKNQLEGVVVKYGIEIDREKDLNTLKKEVSAKVREVVRQMRSIAQTEGN